MNHYLYKSNMVWGILEQQICAGEISEELEDIMAAYHCYMALPVWAVETVAAFEGLETEQYKC